MKIESQVRMMRMKQSDIDNWISKKMGKNS